MQEVSKAGNPIGELIRALRQAGVEVRGDAAKRLANLANLIIRWNRSVNLISRRDTNRLMGYHFCDSASLLPVIGLHRELRVIDIGGSNGLPGLVLACLSQDLKVTVCDAKKKREQFLREACEIAGENASYVISRADDASFQSRNREGFDLALARAVTKLRLLLKWALPITRPGGLIVAYKGSSALEEIKPAERLLLKSARVLVAMAGPWSHWCNPLRNFVIVRKGW